MVLYDDGTGTYILPPHKKPNYYYDALFRLLEHSTAIDLKKMLNNIDDIKQEMERQLLLKS